MARIPISELSAEIESALADYGQDIADEVKKEVKAVASQTIQRLKSTSPQKTGKYASGWTSTVAYEDKENIRVNIQNRNLLDKRFVKNPVKSILLEVVRSG